MNTLNLLIQICCMLYALQVHWSLKCIHMFVWTLVYAALFVLQILCVCVCYVCTVCVWWCCVHDHKIIVFITRPDGALCSRAENFIAFCSNPIICERVIQWQTGIIFKENAVMLVTYKLWSYQPLWAMGFKTIMFCNWCFCLSISLLRSNFSSSDTRSSSPSSQKFLVFL